MIREQRRWNEWKKKKEGRIDNIVFKEGGTYYEKHLVAIKEALKTLKDAGLKVIEIQLGLDENTDTQKSSV